METATQEKLIAETEEIFKKRPYEYGSLQSPTRNGFLAIARMGKEHWNAWAHSQKILTEKEQQNSEFEIDFSGHGDYNLSDIDFSGFLFHANTKFSSSYFRDSSKFVGCTFEGNVFFSRSRFHGKVNFEDSCFKRDAIFEDCYFWEEIEFSNNRSNKAGGASFGGCIFHGEAKFIKANFNGNLDFLPSEKKKNGVNFLGEFTLNQSVIRGKFQMEGSRHKGITIVNECFFENKFNIKKSEFTGSTFITNCSFKEDANLSAGFLSLYFSHNSCGGIFLFENCIFYEAPRFQNRISNSDDNEKMPFNGINFLGCWFLDGVSFRNQVFSGSTIFSYGPEAGAITPEAAHAFSKGARKNGNVKDSQVRHIDDRLENHKRSFQPKNRSVFLGIPDFHGCKFHQDTTFTGAYFNTTPGIDAARAYRTLKLAMEQLKATREEQKFFRLEMKAEHPGLPLGKRWMSTLYRNFSDYGFSLWRPAAWLLTLSLAFGAGYGALANACAGNAACIDIKAATDADAVSGPDRTSAVIKYTLGSVSPVPGLDKMQTELRAPLFGHQGWISITALALEILHKITTLVMTFLFALALRNLFKMKS